MRLTVRLLAIAAAVFFSSCEEKEAVQPGAGITSFSFLKENNPSLTEDVTCTVNEDGTITGTFNDRLSDYFLKASFELDAEYASVNGVVQQSGVSKNNYAKEVVYEVKLKDGTSMTQTVKMKCKPAPQVPVIRITTENGAPVVDKKNYIKGTVVIEDPAGMYWDTPRLELKMTKDGIRGRGNTTWDMPKKPYKMKFDSKVSIFGLGEDKEWVILANYADKTLLRNVVAMKLSEIVGMPWTPAMLPVEVYMNGSYLGCYTFSEHKKVSEHRVDLDIVGESDNSGDAVTGDYYMEIEQNQDETTCFYTQVCGIPMMFSEPEVPTAAQLQYVKEYFRQAETALRSSNFTDPDTGWQKYIDIETFAKAYLVNELTKNIDGNMRKSSFITKKKNDKFQMYHLWDYDLALGNCNYLDDEFGASDGPEGWFIKDYTWARYSPLGYHHQWFTILTKDPAFCAKVKEIWNTHYDELKNIPGFIDQMAAYMKDAQKRNFEKWNILNTHVWPNVVVTGSYQGEIDYLKSFYTSRFNWLDGRINVSQGQIFK
jgi:hypothetical protein